MIGRAASTLPTRQKAKLITELCNEEDRAGLLSDLIDSMPNKEKFTLLDREVQDLTSGDALKLWGRFSANSQTHDREQMLRAISGQLTSYQRAKHALELISTNDVETRATVAQRLYQGLPTNDRQTSIQVLLLKLTAQERQDLLQASLRNLSLEELTCVVHERLEDIDTKERTTIVEDLIRNSNMTEKYRFAAQLLSDLPPEVRMPIFLGFLEEMLRSEREQLGDALGLMLGGRESPAGSRARMSSVTAPDLITQQDALREA